MLKLLLCMIAAFLTAIAVLELRQQRLNLNFQTSRLHSEIEKRQGTLWNQQLQIAASTAPNAISKTIGSENLELTPTGPAGNDARKMMKEATTGGH